MRERGHVEGVLLVLVRLFRSLVLLASPAILLLIAVVLTGPASPSGVGYMVGLLSLTVAVGRARARWAPSLALAGGLLLLVTLVGRVAFGGAGRDLTMPIGAAENAPAARWVDRVFDEEDLAVTGARALRWTGMLRDPDVPALPFVMSDAYRRLREDEGATPSPVVATYLGLEKPGTDDTLEIGDVGTSAGVVRLSPWLRRQLHLAVLGHRARPPATPGSRRCAPSTRWLGDWWSPAGEATLRETVTDLQQRGRASARARRPVQRRHRGEPARAAVRRGLLRDDPRLGRVGAGARDAAPRADLARRARRAGGVRQAPARTPLDRARGTSRSTPVTSRCSCAEPEGDGRGDRLSPSAVTDGDHGFQTAARFWRNASMPSPASSSIMLCAITSAARA